MIGDFTLGNAVVLGGMICLTSAPICDVYFLGVSCFVLLIMLFPTLGNKNLSSRLYVVCLKISTKFLIACNFLAPMDSNGAVGDGFLIASIKSSAALVPAYLFDTPGILLC